MKVSTDKLVAFLGYPARLLDIRFLVILGLLFLLGSSRELTGFAATLDNHLFGFAGIAQNRKLEGSHYLNVVVPAEEQQRFLQDPVSASQIMVLLDELGRSFVRSAIIVLPHALPEKTLAEQLIAQDAYSTIRAADPEADAQLKAISSRWQVLDSIQVNQKYVIAVTQPVDTSHAYHLLNVPDHSEGWYGYLLDAAPVLPSAYPLLGRQAPLSATTGHAQSLLWQSGTGVRHDAVLEAFLRQQGLQQVQVDSTGLQVSPDRKIRSSAQGVIYPRVTADLYQKAGVTSLSIADLLKENIKRFVHEKNVVISAEGSPDAEKLMNGLISLEQGYYAYVPTFYQWLDIGILLFVTLFALAVPYLALQVSLLLYGLMLASFIILQQFFLLVHSQWLPAGEWLVFLSGSYVLMVLWSIKKGLFEQIQAVNAFSGFRLPSLAVFRREPGKRVARPQVRPVLLREPSLGDATDELADFDAADTVMMDAETIRETRRPHNQAAQVFFRKDASVGQKIPASARKMLGPYEILGELGRGAMGIVYLGFDPMMHRKVAIKTLHYNQFDPIELVSMKERFAAEAKAVGQLRHHNIVTMYELREEYDMAYIAMDYVAGKSLASYTTKENLLPVSMVYWIVAEVADALGYAHAAGIVHRDVKPSNILYDENAQEVKVADFGVARLLDSTLARTKTGEVLGSPLYMSPEQIRGEKVTGQSDIYSLGITFYQLLTGELPFKADNIATLTRLILQGKFPAVDDVRRDLPASARKIINKALQKNLENRYADALEMVAALDLALKKDFG